MNVALRKDVPNPKGQPLMKVVTRNTADGRLEKWMKSEPPGNMRIIEMALGRKVPEIGLKIGKKWLKGMRGPTMEERLAGGPGC